MMISSHRVGTITIPSMASRVVKNLATCLKIVLKI